MQRLQEPVNRPCTCRLRPHGNTGTCLIQTPPARFIPTLPPAHGCLSLGTLPPATSCTGTEPSFESKGGGRVVRAHMHLLCCRLGARGGSTRIHSPPLLVAFPAHPVLARLTRRPPAREVCVCVRVPVCNVKSEIIYDYADALPLLLLSSLFFQNSLF